MDLDVLTSCIQTDVRSRRIRCGAINDLTSPKMLAHLLKYDSSQGTYALADKVEATDDSIIVDGKEIKIYARLTLKSFLGEDRCRRSSECTGFYTSKEKASAHIKQELESCYLCTSRK